MLLTLNIENIAVIDHAEINFSDGFNVLTGETGAGKSILIGSINMLLGERTGKDIIRHGCDYASVQGLFNVTSEFALKALEEMLISVDEDSNLLITRRLSADGKNTCRINGRMVTVAELKEIGRLLIDIHGQHDNQALLDKTTHIQFTDSFAKVDLKSYKDLYLRYKETEKQLLGLETDETEKLRQIDILKYEINELDEAKLSCEEEDELKQKKDIINNKKSLLSSVTAAHECLYSSDECAYSSVSLACDKLIKASEIDSSLSETADRINEIMISIADCSSELSEYLNCFDVSDEDIDVIEERLDVIYKLKRKYGGSVEAALKYLEESKIKLKEITFSAERKNQLETEKQELFKALTKEAISLSDKRKKSAEKLSALICDNLKFLCMQNARFSVDFKRCEPNLSGIDEIEFLLSANVSEPLKPLSKIISGGELSRIMLAIKSILSKEDMVNTLIFDEIDTGISGRAAVAVGNKINSLSQDKQIICITHLAQIASVAKTHFLIEKTTSDNITSTSVKMLSKLERINEIARIIGSENISDTTLRQAEDMLEEYNG